jgi:hypothetical protein
MWCAYLFTLIACISLPAAIVARSPLVLITWLSQTFLQLVLLAVIIVGQNVQGEEQDRRAEATYQDAEDLLVLADRIGSTLHEHDAALQGLIEQAQDAIAQLDSAGPDRPPEDPTDP